MAHRPPPALPKYGTYAMPSGSKYAGRTLASIARTREGRDYLGWAAREYPDTRTRRTCAAYLESVDAGREAIRVLIMPEPVGASTLLSPGAKLLFAAIYTAADQDPDHRCRLGNAALENQTGLSPKQVKRLLPELEMMGLIRRELSDAGRRLGIRPTWHPGWDDGAPGGQYVPGEEGHIDPPPGDDRDEDPEVAPPPPPWEETDLDAVPRKLAEETREQLRRPIRWRARPHERDGAAVAAQRKDRRRLAHTVQPETIARAQEAAALERMPPGLAGMRFVASLNPDQRRIWDEHVEDLELSYQEGLSAAEREALDPERRALAERARVRRERRRRADAEHERQYRERLEADDPAP
ncbi:MAG TPA: hypothetical protein VFF52_15500 [Isosphaeraceae bacterium]|nr:hypothetical protein [Isosphaeraceae bacterium]